MIAGGNRDPEKAELEIAGTRRERRGISPPPSPPGPMMRQCNSARWPASTRIWHGCWIVSPTAGSVTCTSCHRGGTSS